MSSPPISSSAGGSRRARYSRSPSGSGAPPSKRSKPSSSGDVSSNNNDQQRLYTSICVKNINPKIPDLEVRELCAKKFTKYGTNLVKIYYRNQERVAFVNFTNCEDARRARHAKTGLVWENMQVLLEPVYYRRTVPAEQPINASSPRGRSPRSPRSPPSPKRRQRRPSSSPPPVSSRSRPYRTSSPPRGRRHYSPYIPIPPDLADYAASKSSRETHAPPSPPRQRRRSRSRSQSASPDAQKSRPKHDDPTASRTESNVQHEPTRTLFVGNLERDVRESKLREVFGRYGTIEEIDLKVPQSSSKRAYAFIQYENMDMAYEARRAMDGHFIGKADCKIGYGKIVPTNCLWVGNIAMDMKRRDLEQAFARYGQLKSFDYSNGDPIAVVSYSDIEHAIAARAKMTGVTQIVDGRKVRTESGQSDTTRRAGLRIDYLDQPTARRFVIVRPQDNTSKQRTSRSSSASSASLERSRSPKDRLRSVSRDDEQDASKNFKRQSHSRSPVSPASAPSKRRTPSPVAPVAGQTFYSPYGSYLSPDDTNNINNVNELITLCEKLNSKIRNTRPTAYSVQFVLKSHAYDARMHFLAGDLNFANAVLSQSSSYTDDKKALNVTQRLRLDPLKFDDLEKKIRTSVSNSISSANGQSSSSSRKQSSQITFAILVTSPTAHLINVNSGTSKQRRPNGRGRSPNHASSSDENDERSQSKRNTDGRVDDESSLSHLITYLATKEAAGVISVPLHSQDQEKAVMNVYPPCLFSKKLLQVMCPSMSFSNGPRTPPSRPTMTDGEHLLVVITNQY
ncbi:unnamed protein product [Adineta ricciae]|uniref:RNA-binding protein 15B n=2 Tax=Adineta ricciae TaxID=249248 RepID=A0A814AA30_ADIRI|nr:unnamed protein product [Adineta ricciae]